MAEKAIQGLVVAREGRGQLWENEQEKSQVVDRVLARQGEVKRAKKQKQNHRHNPGGNAAPLSFPKPPQHQDAGKYLDQGSDADRNPRESGMLVQLAKQSQRQKKQQQNIRLPHANCSRRGRDRR